MPRLRVGALISGRGSNLQALLDAARDPAYPAEIVLVISNVAGAAGLARAAAAGVPQRTVSHRDFRGREPFEAALTEALEAARVELVCLAGFMRVVTAGFVAHWHDRMINIHPSLLPAFPGLHTHRAALDAGVKLHGCTVHYVREQVDAGPIVAQAAVPVAPDDDADSLAARVLEAEHRLYPAALRLIAEGRVRVVGGRAEVDAPPPAAHLLNPPA